MVHARGHGTVSACRRGRCRAPSPCRTRDSWGKPSPWAAGPSWPRRGSPPGPGPGPTAPARPAVAGSGPPGLRDGSAPCSGRARGAPRHPAQGGSSLQRSARRPVRRGRAAGRPPRRLEPRPPLPGISYTGVILPPPQRDVRPTATYSVPKADQPHLLERFRRQRGAELPPGPYESWRVKLSEGTSQATAIMYRSGKLVISGPAPAFDHAVSIVEAVGKPIAPKRPTRPATSQPAKAPPETEPHIGTDEAGKGDFFGPLVTAGVYVDERTAKLLRTLGVRDSKLVGDRELRGLAGNIRDVVEDEKRAVIIVAPKRYNELYKQMRSEGKNLNTLLAWAHTRAIEDLIGHGLKPTFILSDQFGDKRYIESRLMVDTRLSGVPVLQMHRAEADVAVAAASILARDGFLRWLEQAGETPRGPLPKGAAPKRTGAGKP